MLINKNKSFVFFLLIPLFLVLASFSSCDKTDDENPVVNETGTMTDIDGNIYATVKIGNQWWMAENLKVTRYRNGDIIPEVTDSIDWVNQNTGAYCSYENGSSSIPAPGLLYNWAVISNAGNVAPEGWHVPTDDEWKQLELHLGMSQDAADKLTWRGTDQADKLKSNDPDDWAVFENVFSTNESGFTAMAGSCRLFNSAWGDPGLKNTGFWWTSSGFANEEAWYRHLDYKYSNIFRSHADRNYGFSIRCIKD